MPPLRVQAINCLQLVWIYRTSASISPLVTYRKINRNFMGKKCRNVCSNKGGGGVPVAKVPPLRGAFGYGQAPR